MTRSQTIEDQFSFLAGGGEMGERIRAFDWSRTPLGPMERWPQSLRSAISICLGSRFPIVIYWGPALVVLYNDAYAEILGKKHPWALGRPCREVWSEIWEVIAPMFDAVLATGQATWSDDQLLYLERRGYPEECYFSFSFSPVRGADGVVDGIFTAVIENTRRILGERRLHTLREVSARAAGAGSADEACATAAAALSANVDDVPFALLYLLDDDHRRATLAGISGVSRDTTGSPASIDLDDPAAPWPMREAIASGDTITVGDLGPLGIRPEVAHNAVVLPMKRPGMAGPAGFVVAGVSPRLECNDEYKGFFQLLAGHVATAVANARAHEQEKARAEALAEIDRAKTTFFSNVSHEFRTPLTLMLGPVEDLLARGRADLSPAAADQLEVVHRNGLRLLRLVNTLLDFARIEAGRGRARYEPTDLAAFTAELASVFRAAIERAGLRLTVDCPDLGQPVFVDRTMWEKIVLNLLSNAFKFTFEGEIGVTLRAVGDHAELRVRDTGTGVPAEDVPRLFDRFHRVENARARTHEGSGIGLALVQELVGLHGGSITAESAIGTGTTFAVTVPLGSAHLPREQIGGTRELTPASITAAPYVEEALRWLPDEHRDDASRDPALGDAPSAPGLDEPRAPVDHRPRVLVADDNADMRQYVVRLLAQHYRVESAPDGEAALESARRKPPDLVLSDVMMPRLDGFGLLRELRADARTRDVPVIMLSARAGEESRVQGMEAGADDYLIKPFSARELLARARAHLDMARIRRESNAVLRESEARLREADRRKDEFLATLAHELRGPLAPIRNSLEVIKRAQGNGELMQQARGTMERQLNQLVRLVDDLLDIGRITTNKLELRREPVELASIIHHAAEICRSIAEDSGHEFTLTLPPEPIYLHADAARLTQVFQNLLHNACKYTPPNGRIWLTVDRSGVDVVVRIGDTGLGIPPDKLGRIFDMFVQVDRRLEGPHSGLGIGLTLVKRLVEMHEGTVEAFSEGPGRGSEFVVRLPALTGKPAALRHVEQIERERAAVPRRILVVDDNPDAAESLTTLLEIAGHEIHTAQDGLEAVAAAERFRPDVVLLDIGLPKLNGFDAARRIREQPWGRTMTLVALTGWGQEQDRRKSKEAGFDGHLVKPVGLDSLMKLLAALPAAR